MLKISVTIAVYKREQILIKILEALANQSLKKEFYEIILCDSQSSDQIPRILHHFIEKYPNLSIKLKQTKNVLAAKRNLGVQESLNDIVIFMDDDCVPEYYYLEKYFNYFNFNNDQADFVCGVVRFPPEWVCDSSYYKFRDEEGFHQVHSFNKDLNFKTIVVMNMAFKKSTFIDNNLFVDEDFHGYGMEDQDFGFRITEAGLSIRSIDALIHHYETSGNIEGYGIKIYQTAKNGMNNLYNKNKKCFLNLTNLKYIDSYYDYLPYKLLRFIFLNKYTLLLSKGYCNLSEKYPIFFSIAMFRYTLAHYYYLGSKERLNSNNVGENDDWYI